MTSVKVHSYDNLLSSIYVNRHLKHLVMSHLQYSLAMIAFLLLKSKNPLIQMIAQKRFYISLKISQF